MAQHPTISVPITKNAEKLRKTIVTMIMFHIEKH